MNRFFGSTINLMEEHLHPFLDTIYTMKNYLAPEERHVCSIGIYILVRVPHRLCVASAELLLRSYFYEGEAR